MQMERLRSKDEKRRMASPSGNNEFPAVTKKRRHVEEEDNPTDLQKAVNTSLKGSKTTEDKMLPSNVSFLPSKRKRPACDVLPPDAPLLSAKRMRKQTEVISSSVSKEIPELQQTELLGNKRFKEQKRGNKK